MRTLFRSISLIAVFLAVSASQSVASGVKALSLGELEYGIADRLNRVEEFRFIEQEAVKLGVRAWLFGGTAAGYAHYVKWDLQREKGDKRFQPDRFDYDYTNIYRSTQDLDIVIDGNTQQAQALQSALAEHYPHLQGSKTAWEVRLLTQDMGDKQAILNNSDFMNQHTDSNSTGLIEITKPQAGESVIRDVRNWNSKEPYFLKDVHDGALHYYFSLSHDTTKLAREGRNPPILSAIRYLTKAFQYELQLRPEDLAQIQQVIKEFDPHADARNPYVANWIEKNGKKLIQNAVNIEYAWNTLEGLGLRKKLEAIKSNPGELDSLAWWMNKEPLRTKPVGSGSGKTARELGLDIVAHETGNFLAYESITRAHTGDTNVLISRASAVGESAAHGDGFYTKVGREGARGTGLTIRFHLDPNARENLDFDRSGDFIIVKNKAALQVIPESLNMSLVEYFEMLARNSDKIDASDQGIFEKLKRRIVAKSQANGGEQMKEVLKIVKLEIEHSGDIQKSPVLREWFALGGLEKYPEVLEALMAKGTMNSYILSNILSQPKWKDHPELIDKILDIGENDTDVVQHILSKTHWKDHPEWVERLLTKGTVDLWIAWHVFQNPAWKDHSEWIEQLINKNPSDPRYDRNIAHSLGKDHWLDRAEPFVRQLLDKGTVDKDIITGVLSNPHWANHPEWVEEILRRGMADRAIAESILPFPQWKDHPEWIEHLMRKGDPDVMSPIANQVLTRPFWKENPELLRVTGGAEVNYLNLKAAFERGESVRVSAPTSGACISQHLNQLLK